MSSFHSESCTYDELTLDDGGTHTDKSACKEITCSGGETSEKFIGLLLYLFMFWNKIFGFHIQPDYL